MKYIFLLLILIGCAEIRFTMPVMNCQSTTNTTYTSREKMQAIIDRYAAAGIPGISLAIKKGDDLWTGTAGYASIEQHVKLAPCHLMYAQSAAKTYTAVTILQLVDEGKIELDKSIRLYFPASVFNHIENSDGITVRMLLNHTSGIHDYAYDYAYATYLLNNGDKVFPKSIFLEYILDKKADFEPGAKYSYCNSNFYLLAYMVEYLTGKTHASVIREKILQPLGLTNTFYREEVKEEVVNSRLANCYLDRFSDGKIENVSKQQENNILAMMGDDSIVATPEDYILFLQGLLQGKLVSAQSLSQMKTWTLNSDGNPVYGLGLAYHEELGIPGYGHGGSGLGAGCSLYYFPSKDVTVFIGVNFSTLIQSPETDLLEKMKKEIYAIALGEE